METTEVEVLSLETVIQNKLVRNNVTEQVLTALKEKYGGMKLKALDDKESYLEIKAAAKDCAKVRTLATKLCKEGREDAVKVQKLWVAKEKEVVGRVAEVEDALDAEIAKYDAEVERKANEEKQRQEDAYIARQATLTKMGATYENGSFVLGDASFEAVLIKSSSQDVWEDAIVPKFQAEYEKIQAVIIEEQRKRDEAAAEMKRQQEELARQQEEFRKQQAEMQRQKDEAERLEREKQQAEQQRLQKERNELHQKRWSIIGKYQPEVTTDLWQFSEEIFVEMVDLAKSAYDKREEEKRQHIEAAAAQKERERIEAEQRQAEIQRQQDEAKKAEEMAQASDKVKYADLVAKIAAINIPEMRSGQYRKKAAIIREKLEEIAAL